MRELLKRIEFMSRIYKMLKAFLIVIPKGQHHMWDKLHEKPKVYPYRFMHKAARESQERKLDLYLAVNMYQ